MNVAKRKVMVCGGENRMVDDVKIQSNGIEQVHKFDTCDK